MPRCSLQGLLLLGASFPRCLIRDAYSKICFTQGPLLRGAYSEGQLRGPTPGIYSEGLLQGPIPRCLLRSAYSKVPTPRCRLQGYLHRGVRSKATCSELLTPRLSTLRNLQPGVPQVMRVPRSQGEDSSQGKAAGLIYTLDYTKPVPRTENAPGQRLRPGACAQEQGARKENLWGEVPRGGMVIFVIF